MDLSRSRTASSCLQNRCAAIITKGPLCRREDSNLHSLLNRQVLSLVRLPFRHFDLVRQVRFELTQPCGQKLLRLSCLPFHHWHLWAGAFGFTFAFAAHPTPDLVLAERIELPHFVCRTNALPLRQASMGWPPEIRTQLLLFIRQLSLHMTLGQNVRLTGFEPAHLIRAYVSKTYESTVPPKALSGRRGIRTLMSF